MNVYKFLSLSLLAVLLGGTAQADAPSDCKNLHVQHNIDGYSLIVHRVKCGEKESTPAFLNKEAEAVYSVEGGSSVYIEAFDWFLGLHKVIWPERKIGSGRDVNCTGSYIHPKCEEKPVIDKKRYDNTHRSLNENLKSH